VTCFNSLPQPPRGREGGRDERGGEEREREEREAREESEKSESESERASERASERERERARERDMVVGEGGGGCVWGGIRWRRDMLQL
jgi:hypothetical protein